MLLLFVCIIFFGFFRCVRLVGGLDSGMGVGDGVSVIARVELPTWVILLLSFRRMYTRLARDSLLFLLLGI